MSDLAEIVKGPFGMHSASLVFEQGLTARGRELFFLCNPEMCEQFEEFCIDRLQSSLETAAKRHKCLEEAFVDLLQSLDAHSRLYEDKVAKVDPTNTVDMLMIAKMLLFCLALMSVAYEHADKNDSDLIATISQRLQSTAERYAEIRDKYLGQETT